MTYEITSQDEAVGKLNELPNNVLYLVADAIAQFNALDLAKAPEQQIVEIVDFLTDAYLVFPFAVTAKMEIWRTRKTIAGRLLENTGELGYCPGHLAPMQRFNKAQRSVFYAGSTPDTTMAECRLAQGDYFHLISYEIQPDPQILLVSIGNIDAVRRGERRDVLGGERTDLLTPFLEKLRPDVRLAVGLVDAFLFDRLTRKDESEYVVTAAIAADFMELPGVGGLVYPSVAHKGGINFALKPEVYDKNVQPKAVLIRKIVMSLGYGAYHSVGSQPVAVSAAQSDIVWPTPPDWLKLLDDLAAQELDRLQHG